MKIIKYIWLLAITLSLTGCAQKIDFTTFYKHRPKSIVVVPVLNESPEVNAAPVFITSITRPLAERGYYVFPVYLIDLILRDFGLVEAGHIHQLPLKRFSNLFGADAVLFVTIKDWSTKYIIVHSSVTVEMEYILKDTKTGLVLWENKQTYVHNSGGGGNLIAMAVSAAINAITTDYLPLARQANNIVLNPPKGIPAGPYHPNHKKDQDKF